MDIKEFFENHGSVAVAFSGGVDSAVLLCLAKKYAKKVCAYYVKTQFQPQFELDDALEIKELLGVEMKIIRLNVLSDERVAENPKNRCYFCKRNIFSAICNAARDDGFETVLDGTNASDDLSDRPGVKALNEYGVLSPLMLCNITKEDIRSIARENALPVADKPSYACLYTRFVYGEEITPEKLQMVGSAEQFLMDLGFIQLRVRIHGIMARIEVPLKDFPRILEGDTREKIYRRLKELGFSYVTLDLGGYRTGSMNETLANRS